MEQLDDCRVLQEALAKFEVGFCLNCKIEGCELDKKPQAIQESISNNIVLQCNHCHDYATLSFVGSTLGTTSRYLQLGDKVYHLTICGVAKRVGTSY